MSQTPSHQRRDVWPTNCTPKNARASVFCILPVLHTQDTCALVLNFEVGPFARHFLLLSFFLSFFWCCYERNSIHTASMSFYFSRSSGSPSVFHPAGDGCWIHVNVGCSACIYSTPLFIFLNDEPRLAHRRQQSVGSVFQFHYRITSLACRLFLLCGVRWHKRSFPPVSIKIVLRMTTRER